MAEAAAKPKFPTRDGDGRVVSLPEFLAAAMGSAVLTFILLAVIDLVFAGFKFGNFGHINGWISVALAGFLILEDFRAWKGARFRVPVFAAALLLGIVVCVGVMQMLPDGWLPLLSGALAGVAALIVYVVLWFTGIRLIGGEG